MTPVENNLVNWFGADAKKDSTKRKLEESSSGKERNVEPRLETCGHNLLDGEVIFQIIAPYLNLIDVISYRGVNRKVYDILPLKEVIKLGVLNKIFDLKFWNPRWKKFKKPIDERIIELANGCGCYLKEVKLNHLQLLHNINDKTLDILSRKCRKLEKISIAYDDYDIDPYEFGHYSDIDPLLNSGHMVHQISDQGLQVLAAACAHVKEIRLQNFPVIYEPLSLTGKGILALIQAAPRLDTLILGEWHQRIFGDELLADVITSCASLKKLGLFDCLGLTNAGLINCNVENKPLPLTSFGISYTSTPRSELDEDRLEVAPAGIEPFIRNCPYLHSLYIHQRDMEEEEGGAKRLIGFVINQVCPQLRFLALSLEWMPRNYINGITRGLRNLTIVVLRGGLIDTSPVKIENELKRRCNPNVKVYWYDRKKSTDLWVNSIKTELPPEELTMLKAFLRVDLA